MYIKHDLLLTGAIKKYHLRPWLSRSKTVAPRNVTQVKTVKVFCMIFNDVLFCFYDI